MKFARLLAALFFSVAAGTSTASDSGATPHERASLQSRLKEFSQATKGEQDIRHFILVFSFTSDHDGEAFIHSASRIQGVATGPLYAWPNNVWLTELNVRIVPTEEALADLGARVHELAVLHRARNESMIIAKKATIK